MYFATQQRHCQMNKKPRIAIFGTHPLQMNGYSQVVYHLARELDAHPEQTFDVSVFGFQNFIDGNAHGTSRTLPASVDMYDASRGEKQKFNGQSPEMGFFFSGIIDYVNEKKPDIIVLYNDMVVVSKAIEQLQKLPEETKKTLKVVVYADQVYLGTRKNFVSMLNDFTHMVIAFTPYWLKVLTNQGLNKVPVSFLRHGFDDFTYHPVPKDLARKFLGINKDDFVVLNINRNQPRKRWDTCLQAFAEFISRHMDEPIKLIAATTVDGGWNLLEIYEHELKKRGMTLEQGMKFLVLLDKPQMLSDFDVNVLYNAADVGINTCDGEGFGLCNFQQAGVGIPQIVPQIGGFLDFFSSDRAKMVNPALTYHIDASRDGVGGEGFMCHFQDFTQALEEYYMDADLRKLHGERCRSFITQNYKWSSIGDRMNKLMKQLLPQVPEVSEVPEIKETPKNPKTPKTPRTVKKKTVENNSNKEAIKRLLKEKSKARQGKSKS